VSKEGSIEAEWDLLTWKELYKLATEVPAAGVWLQGKYYGQVMCRHGPGAERLK